MKLKRQTIPIFLAAGLLLAACGSGQIASPALTPVLTHTTAPTIAPPPTNTPAPAATTTPTPVLTNPSIGAITMDCTDWVSINTGIYRAENNTWGKGDLSGWSQCIGLGTDPDGALTARWTWDWLESGGNVKAYPEVVAGQKPGSRSTTPVLPLQISLVESAVITYDVASTHTGSGNLTFDIWLTDTANPDTWGVPPITREIMIWLEAYGSMAPGGNWMGKEQIDGVEYSVYVGQNWGDGWTYIAFLRAPYALGTGSLDLADFLAYILEKELATGEEFLASIEFGNEVATGSGETILNQYAVSVQKK